MNAAQSSFALVHVLAQTFYPATSSEFSFPWLWALVALAAAATTFWYFMGSRPKGGGPPSLTS
jgi:hypothetical protein